MTEKMPNIYFYLPESLCLKAQLPENPESYWQWYLKEEKENLGIYTWTLLTYLYLKKNNFPCHFTNEFPSEGICLSHRSLLSDSLQPNPKLLVIALQSDRGRHPYAQLHVVQNPLQQTNSQYSLWKSFYLTHWTQPSLIPRDPKRSNKFENIAFFGQENNLIDELRQTQWKNTLQEMGLNWQIIPRFQWNDYSKVDAVIAIRKFGYSWDHSWKPATKLYNAWLAGVPAILGCESAYQAKRKNKFDYLEANSYEELVAGMKQLNNDKELRNAIKENAKLRAKEIEPDETAKKWQDFLINTAIPTYENWLSLSEYKRNQFFKLRSLAYPVYFYQRQLKYFRAKIITKLTKQKFVGQDRRYL